MKTSPSEELETLLIHCFQGTRLENIPINRPVLWEESTEMALRLEVDSFEARNGWLILLNKQNLVVLYYLYNEVKQSFSYEKITCK
jgi:hypothetical protein